RTGHLYQYAVAGGGGFLDCSTGMTNHIHHDVNLVVAQRRGLLRCLQLGGKFEVASVPSHFLHQDLDGSPLTGAGIADVDPLAFDILEFSDASVLTCKHRKGLWMQGKDSAQVRVGPLIAKVFAGSLIGVILPVRLDDTTVQFAFAQGIEVVDGAGGTLDRTADAVIFPGLVHQATDGAAGRVINACHTAGTDGNESLLGRRGMRCTGKAKHAHTSHGERHEYEL